MKSTISSNSSLPEVRGLTNLTSFPKAAKFSFGNAKTKKKGLEQCTLFQDFCELWVRHLGSDDRESLIVDFLAISVLEQS
jgi:hypothetical protein